MADTFGAIDRSLTGNVDKWSLDLLKQNNADAIAQAMPGADPSTIQTQIDATNAQASDFLKSIDADPSQATLRTPLGTFPSLAWLFGNDANNAASGIALGVPESNAAGTSSANAETRIATFSQSVLSLAAIGLAVYFGFQLVKVARSK